MGYNENRGSHAEAGVGIIRRRPEGGITGVLNSDEILRRIKENRARIKKFGVKKIGLFGSYISGKQRKESDIDIVVEFEEGKKTFDNYMELKFFLEELFNCKVDLVILESIKPELKQHILGSVKYATGV